MKKYSWYAIVAVIIIIVGVYVISSNHSQNRKIKIGLISILSGDYATVGENFKNGVLLALDEYKSKNPKSEIEVIVEDDGFNSAKALGAYNKLTSVNKIDGLINVSTASIDAIYDRVIKDGIPVAQGGEQGRSPTDDNVFGMFPDSISSERDFGKYMASRNVKEMTIVYTKLDAMIRFVEAFKEGFKGKVNEIVIDASEKDFRTHALKASQNGNNAVGIFMFPEQGAQFIKEYFKLTKNKPTIFFDTSFISGFSDYKRILGDMNILNGSIVGGMRLEDTQAFKEAYKTKYGIEPPFLSDIGYDSFNLLIDNYDSNRSKWVNNIKNKTHDGVSGKIKFNETGNRLPETQMKMVKNGELEDIK